MFPPSRWKPAAAIAAALSLPSLISAQTWTSCNPLTQSKPPPPFPPTHGPKLTAPPACPPNPALGMAIDVDFTKGSVPAFVAGGGGTVVYGSDGAVFTVARGGDAPQVASVFFIMFGHVEVTMAAAPGAGIVSSLVLQSDDLDEIDYEWIGSDTRQVQTNYFGKGRTTTYNRGQFNPTGSADNTATYLTYAIDWTADRIVWSVGGVAVRTLTAADAGDEYPQTPMQVKFGAWSGGDPANAPGTIQWANGPTDYSRGPFAMRVRDAKVVDYSTGKSYSYSDTTGSWRSIRADGGAVNGNLDKAGKPVVTATAASGPTSLSPGIPAGGIGKATQTGWPWTRDGSTASPNPVPDGWVMTAEGKIVPAAGGRVGPPNAWVMVGPVVLLGFAVFGGRWW